MTRIINSGVSRRALLHGCRLLLSTTAAVMTVASAEAQEATQGDPVAQEQGLRKQGAEERPAARSSAIQLDAVTVTATRTPQAVKDVPGSVSVITADEIDRRLVTSPRDLVRYEPGVSIGNDPTRSGLSNYVIRGIGGNRVLVQTDGMRLPDAPFSSPTYSRDYVDLDTVKQVEIVRGPASSLYGSDAIGGIVSYITKDPEDYLATFGRDVYVGAKVGYDGANDAFSETATLAGRRGDLEGLLVVTRRDGGETETNGSIPANPQDFFSNNVLGKLVWQAGDADRLRLTGEYRTGKTWTDIRSELVPGSVLGSVGRDETDRLRLSLDHSHDASIGFIDRLDWQLSYQKVERSEDSTQDRFSGGDPRRRQTWQDFEQSIWGLDVQLGTDLVLGGVPNTLTYGIDLDYSDTVRARDRTETNLTTGTVTRFVGGELYPNKPFPDSKTLLAGAYIQDEIRLGRLTLVPGLRADYYRLDPDPDQAFANSNTSGFDVGEVTETALSPKLGATYDLTGGLTLFGQYSHGFRSPPYDDANIGFTNPIYGYAILPNLDLKPETSDGVELGLRGNYDSFAFTLSGFYTRYRDFIDQVVVGNSGGLILFQAQNLDRVDIWGAEAGGEWQVGSGFTLLGSAAYARGEDKETGRPVDSVDPLKLVGGIRYDSPDIPWGAELTATYTDRKDRVSDETFFRPPSSTVVDLTAWWDVTPNVTVNAGLFNLTDERYWTPQDVVGFSSGRSDLDRFVQPGRTVAVNASFRW